jgi:hypothetical protein
LEETVDLVEEEIRMARAKFEDDISKIEEKFQNSYQV